MNRSSLARILAAFAAVYVIWGSTYLAIRFAVETMPPFLMAGTRWIVAGSILYAWRRAAGDPRPTLLHWRSAAIIGAFLVVGGNGTVSWAEQFVESGLTALLIAVVPVFIALLEWMRPGGSAPSARVWTGILLGLAGVALLVWPSIQSVAAGADAITLLGMGAILLASFLWATGSLYSRRAPLPKSVLQGASMEMLAGGLILAILGVGTGELPRIDLAGAGARAWLSLSFLIVFGSIVGFTAYVWLLQVVRPELVSTYAFVNPIVAVFLGVLLAGEAFTARTFVVAALVVAAVAIVVTAPRPMEVASPASESA